MDALLRVMEPMVIPVVTRHRLPRDGRAGEGATGSSLVDLPADASRPLAPRRSSRSWRGMCDVRGPCYTVSTRRTGYAGDADCTGRYLRLERLAGLDSDPAHQQYKSETLLRQHGVALRQLRVALRQLETLHASHGPQDEELRHRPSTDAAAGGDLRVAGRDEREVTNRANGNGLGICR